MLYPHRYQTKRRKALGLKEPPVEESAFSANPTKDDDGLSSGGGEKKEEGKEQQEDGEGKEERKEEEEKENEGEAKDGIDKTGGDSVEDVAKASGGMAVRQESENIALFRLERCEGNL